MSQWVHNSLKSPTGAGQIQQFTAIFYAFVGVSACVLLHSRLIHIHMFPQQHQPNYGLLASHKAAWTSIRFKTELACVVLIIGASAMYAAILRPSPLLWALSGDFLLRGICCKIVQLCDIYMFYDRLRAVVKIPKLQRWFIHVYIWTVIIGSYSSMYTIVPFFFDTNLDSLRKVLQCIVYIKAASAILFHVYVSLEFLRVLWSISCRVGVAKASDVSMTMASKSTVSSLVTGKYKPRTVTSSSIGSGITRRKVQNIAFRGFGHAVTSSIGLILFMWDPISGGAAYVLLMVLGMHFWFNVPWSKLGAPTITRITDFKRELNLSRDRREEVANNGLMSKFVSLQVKLRGGAERGAEQGGVEGGAEGSAEGGERGGVGGGVVLLGFGDKPPVAVDRGRVRGSGSSSNVAPLPPPLPLQRLKCFPSQRSSPLGSLPDDNITNNTERNSLLVVLPTTHRTPHNHKNRHQKEPRQSQHQQHPQQQQQQRQQQPQQRQAQLCGQEVVSNQISTTVNDRNNLRTQPPTHLYTTLGNTKEFLLSNHSGIKMADTLDCGAFPPNELLLTIQTVKSQEDRLKVLLLQQLSQQDIILRSQGDDEKRNSNFNFNFNCDSHTNSNCNHSHNNSHSQRDSHNHRNHNHSGGGGCNEHGNHAHQDYSSSIKNSNDDGNFNSCSRNIKFNNSNKRRKSNIKNSSSDGDHTNEQPLSRITSNKQKPSSTYSALKLTLLHLPPRNHVTVVVSGIADATAVGTMKAVEDHEPVQVEVQVEGDVEAEVGELGVVTNSQNKDDAEADDGIKVHTPPSLGA